jgi:hypothetical protein
MEHPEYLPTADVKTPWILSFFGRVRDVDFQNTLLARKFFVRNRSTWIFMIKLKTEPPNGATYSDVNDSVKKR